MGAYGVPVGMQPMLIGRLPSYPVIVGAVAQDKFAWLTNEVSNK